MPCIGCAVAALLGFGGLVLGQVASRARATAGWRARAPRTLCERRTLYMRCGKRAFLLPAQLKFPVMAKFGPCALDCCGLRAAKSRAAQHGYQNVVRVADRRARRAACSWKG